MSLRIFFGVSAANQLLLRLKCVPCPGITTLQGISKHNFQIIPKRNVPLLNTSIIFTFSSSTRFYSSSFFTKTTAGQLWKGVTSVSNAGKKRGRKGRRAKDLNKGQVLGLGKINMVWPGLNAPVLRGKEVVEQREIGPDKQREERMKRFHDDGPVIRRVKLHPLERGWTGGKLGGRSIGPPEPKEMFEGFDSIVLEFKTVTCMRTAGRTRRVAAFVVTGNKSGLIGFGKGKANEGKTALKQAKNRAGQRLRFIERFEEHTVHHDFYTRFGSTQIFVKKKPRGYGLICHRALKTICELVGITDLYAKVEGSTNVINLTKAFILGLQKQKSHQQWADEMALHLVEMRKERENYPVVVASPTPGKESSCSVQDKEYLSFQQIALDGRIVKKKEKKLPFYTRLPSWQRRLKKMAKFEHNFEQRLQVLTEYGAYESFLTMREKTKAPAQVSNTEQKAEE